MSKKTQTAIAALRSAAVAGIVLAGLASGVQAKDFPPWPTIQDSSPRSVWDQIKETSPRSYFDQLNETTPRSPFDQINEQSP